MKCTRKSKAIKIKMNYTEYLTLCRWFEKYEERSMDTQYHTSADYMAKMTELMMYDLYQKVMRKDDCPIRGSHVKQSSYSISLTIAEAIVIHYQLRQQQNSFVLIDLMVNIDRLLK